jgi:DNA-binding PadR family transcriptional regulator
MFNQSGGLPRDERLRWRGRDYDGAPAAPGAGAAPWFSRPHRGRERDPGFGGHGRGAGPGRPFPFGFGRGLGRGRAMRRGDVRAAILAVLADHPMHGYQVMQELAERSGGAWAPSAGSVYPTLQQLEDEGLVRSEEQDGRRVFTLTDEGRVHASRARDAGAPWPAGRGREAPDLRGLALQVARATMQVNQAGTPKAIEEARRILAATRRDLYRLLADDAPDEGVGDDAPEGEAPEGVAD